MAYNSERYKRYYEKNKDKCKARNKAHYTKDEVKAKAAQRMAKKWHKDETVRSRSKEYKLEWYHANKDKELARQRAQREANPLLYQFRGIKAKCKKNGIEFGFTDFDHFLEVVPQPTTCPVFGIDLCYAVGRSPHKAEIDRIDPTKGYVPGNVGIISAKANQLKQDNTAETLQALLDYVRG